MSSSTPQPGTIEKAPPLSTLPNTSWKNPSYTLPAPSLQFLFHLECDMEAFRHIGEGPYGDRSTVIFKGGRFEGPKLRGEILGGGGDWEIVRNHDDQQTAHLNTRYNLLTHDGATIYLQTTGTRTGSREILEKLGDDTGITADQYKMRLQLVMETGDPRYSWINSAVFVASAGRNGGMVVYDAFELL
nr:upf0311 protein [Quercus suber]